MRFFNVICQRKRAPGAQYLCGNDESLAKQTAAEESSNLKRGDSVTLWSIDHQTRQTTEIVGASDFPVDARAGKPHPDKIDFGFFGGLDALRAGVRHLRT